MILLDTGYFIAMLAPKDQLHTRAVVWSRRLNETTLVSEYVIWETLDHFADTRHRRDAGDLVRRIRADGRCTFVNASPSLFDIRFSLYETRQDQTWSFTDCVSFEIMKQRHLDRALTFDHHFEQAGFQALLRRDP
jgi:uncharacterized protein